MKASPADPLPADHLGTPPSRRVLLRHGMTIGVGVGLLGLRPLGFGSSRALADGERGDEVAAFEEITPASQAAIQRGLTYLAQTQAEDGSWGSLGAADPSKYARHAGISALACIAFLADGHVPDRGAYAEVVERGLSFVLDCGSASGLLAAETSHGPMYGHGFATLFLGEIYGMTGDPRVRETLLRAVRMIVQSQNREGGWRYNPGDFDADISVTICQIMALRSARNAGIGVPDQTIERAIGYVRACQNPRDGGFNYMISGGSTAFPRSAAGLAALYYAGVYEGEEVERALDYLNRQENEIVNRGGHYYYGQYYAAQAMYLAGGEHWARWFPAVRDELIGAQQQNGSWPSANSGSPYATAMSLIILQMPNRLLPIFQR